MGIVQRQSTKNVLVGFIGVLVGGLATIFIYSANKESYGYVQWLYGTATFLLPFTSVGVITLVMKFYPKFKATNGQDNGFIWMILAFYLMAFSVFLIAFSCLKDDLFSLLRWLDMDRDLRLDANIEYILILGFLVGLIMILTHQASNLGRIVVPEILHNLSYKVYLAALVILVASGYVAIDQMPYAIIGFFILVALALTVYLAWLGGIRLDIGAWRRQFRSLHREMADYALFGALNTMGSVLAFRIDIIMIGTMIGYRAVGLYSILLFFANVIEIPTRAVSKITSPIISRSFETEDLAHIRMIYQKSSLNLILVGIPIFLLIWFSLPDLEQMASGENNFIQGRYVFLLLAAAKLLDMLFSVNSQIIQYSKDYRWLLVFMLVLAGVNVYLNYIFIDQYGILGAAMASISAFGIFNGLKFALLHFKWQMQPFSAQSIYALAVGTLMFGLLYYLPKFSTAPLNIITTGVLLGLVYAPALYISRISPDLNVMVEGYWSKITKRMN